MNKLKANEIINLQSIFASYKNATDVENNSNHNLSDAIKLTRKRIELLKAILKICSEDHHTHVKQELSFKNKFKAGLAIVISIINGFITGFIAYLGALKIFEYFIHALTISTQIAALGIGFLDAAASALFAIWDLQKDYGIKALFRADKYTRLINKELKLHKALVGYTTHAANNKLLTSSDQDILNKICLLNFKSLNSHDKNLRQPKQRRALSGSLKWTYLSLSGGLKFASGLLIAKSVLGLLGLVSLSFPIIAAVGVTLGLIISSVFVLTKARSTHNVLSAMLDKNVTDVKEKLHKHLHVKQSRSQFISQINLQQKSKYKKASKDTANDARYIRSRLQNKSLKSGKKIALYCKNERAIGKVNLKGGLLFKQRNLKLLSAQQQKFQPTSKLAI